MEPIGKFMLVAGLAIAAIGLLLWLGPQRERGGWLPGDLVIDKGNFKLVFPVVTCLVVSAIATLLFWLFRR